MHHLNPSNRRAERGTRLVRASVALGLAASVGLQIAGGGIREAAVEKPDASRDCASSASPAFTAL